MSNENLAMTRIAGLVDENSFVELGSLVTARATDFNLDGVDTPSDGVVTGFGTIDGNLVYVYSQNSKVLGGTIGEMHARKIAHVYDMAIKMGAPVIGIIDCAGVRLQESVDALEAFGALYKRVSLASGVIPQFSIVAGMAGGGMAVIPALSDFAFATNEAKIFVNSPNALAGNFEGKCNTADPAFQSENTGVYDGVDSFEAIAGKVRTLVSMLPSNNSNAFDAGNVTDDMNRASELAAADAGCPAKIFEAVGDAGSFVETKKDFGGCVVTGFMKLGGVTVGALGISNKDAVICANGAEKAAAFVRFCDAFEIPVFTVTNIEGFKATKESELRIAKALAALSAAFANATVPKVNLIAGKSYGSAYAIANCKALGADVVYSWPDAKVGMMDAKLAASIICAEDKSADIAKITSEYESKQNSVATAAARGYVDRIVNYDDTRKYVIAAFEMLYSKNLELPYKKHSAK